MFESYRMVKKTELTQYIYVSILCMSLYGLYLFLQRKVPHISTIHVINLDRDTERWDSIRSQGETLGLPIQRFSAIYGKDIPYKLMRRFGIGNAMVRADRHDHKGERLHNLGVVGCFLSHRELLRDLLDTKVPESHGHLILEDDVRLPNDFLQPNGRWDTLRRNIPSDWDIVWLRMWHPNGNEIAPGIRKLESNPGIRCNLGAFAYVVRHGAIPKILEWLHYMIDAYDEQMNLKFNEWNCYILHPGIVEIDSKLQEQSSINTINTPQK